MLEAKTVAAEGVCSDCAKPFMFLGFWVKTEQTPEEGALVCKRCLGPYLEVHWMACEATAEDACDYCHTYEVIFLQEM